GRTHGGEGGGAAEGAVGGVERSVDCAPGRVPGRGDERVVGRVEEPVTGLGDCTPARAQAGEDGGETGRLLGEAERDVVEEAAWVGDDVHRRLTGSGRRYRSFSSTNSTCLRTL